MRKKPVKQVGIKQVERILRRFYDTVVDQNVHSHVTMATTELKFLLDEISLLRDKLNDYIVEHNRSIAVPIKFDQKRSGELNDQR